MASISIVFISGVELGYFALNGILDSLQYQNSEVEIVAIIGLDQSKANITSGFQKFDDLPIKPNTRIHYVKSIKDKQSIDLIENYQPDYIFIIGWSELAPTSLLDIPMKKHKRNFRYGRDYGCIGMHPTLLPEGRGRAPIPWTLIKGLDNSGVTLFYLEEKADAGDIIIQKKFCISKSDNASTIYHKVAELHYKILNELMPLIVNGSITSIPQDESKATYWEKRSPSDGIINWNKTGIDIFNWIRALTHPYPGAFTFWKNKKIIFWEAIFQFEEKRNSIIHNHHPGQIECISEEGILVICRESTILITRVQFEMEQEISAWEFAQKNNLRVGDCFENH
jgi:methionyl-tRNA formyltransferase